jgi:hypothetical protein
MNSQYKMDAVLSKEHLERYQGSITEVYVEKENMDKCKKVFLDVVGEELMKRINFLPKY